MGALYDFAYNRVYMRLPRYLRSGISRIVYKPIIDKKTVVAGSPEFHSHVSIGAYSTIQDDSFFAQCEIGKYCACAKGVRFLHTQHRIKAFSQLGRLSMPPFHSGAASENLTHPGAAILLAVAHVGNDVWLGEYSTIKCGVTIGNGAVIGARAVVTKDIPPYAIAVGVPAQVVGYRFEPQKIELMEKIRWWDWPEEKIAANYELLCDFSNRLVEGI